MTAPKPGSWIKPKVSNEPTLTTTSSTKTASKKSSEPSTRSRNTSEKKRDPKFDRCVCGHQRRDHTEVARAEFVFGGVKVELDHPCTGEGCDCQIFDKAPFKRKEHLTNRPFAENTSMIILQDRLTVHDGTKNNRKKGKK